MNHFDTLRRGGGVLLVLLIALGELINRVWVAQVFLRSGLNKLQSWDATLFLFEEEYQVPLLSPELAAWVGTGAELFFPVLLIAGLAGRFSAGVLLVFNLVAVLSYPGLNAAGIQGHQIWGTMLLVTLIRGPGLLSLDAAISALWQRRGGRQPTPAHP